MAHVNGFRRQDLVGYLLAALCAIWVYRTLITFHVGHLDDITASAWNVIAGTPYWRAQQNRLLGPYAVLAASWVLPSFLVAWKVVTGAVLLVQSVLVYFILRRLEQNRVSALAGLGLYWFAFLVLQCPLYYVWDQIDMLVFTLFAYGIVAAKPMPFHLVLFGVALLNRESALFIAVYIALSGISLGIAPPTFRVVLPSRIVFGALLVAAGALYTHFVRHALFVGRLDGTMDEVHAAIGNHVYLVENLQRIFGSNFTTTHFAVSITLLVGLVLLFRKLPSLRDADIKAALILLFMLAQTIVFGSVNETRLYFITIPFVLLLSLAPERRP